jgi:hypothetical protein
MGGPPTSSRFPRRQLASLFHPRPRSEPPEGSKPLSGTVRGHIVGERAEDRLAPWEWEASRGAHPDFLPLDDLRRAGIGAAGTELGPPGIESARACSMAGPVRRSRSQEPSGHSETKDPKLREGGEMIPRITDWAAVRS